MQCSDHNLEIASLSGAAGNNKDECSKTFQLNHNTESDQEENQDHDDEIKSDDVFFEDISSSLINIRQDEVNVPSVSTSKQVSIISNPFENTQICVPDLGFNSHSANSRSGERSLNSEQNEVMHLPNQYGRGMRNWRVINVTNQDSIQEITQEDGNEKSRDFPADLHLESNYQRQHITTKRRVYRYSQNSYHSTSTPAQIAVSESSDVISSDLRMSISELEHDSGSVFDEEELVTSGSERFFIN